MSLVVSELTKKYGNKTVVDKLSFEMKGPGVYALLGTNGAGKTTAIRMILGMLAKDGGSVLWNGAPLSCDSCNIGYLAEERGLYPKYPLMDQLIYFASLRSVSTADAKKRIRYWSDRLELDEYLYPNERKLTAGPAAKRALRTKKVKPKLADQLSKGNQQKIQLLTALISNPELLVLDEPLSGLDPVNSDLFKEIIRDQIAAGKYLIMSSHQMGTVEEFCTDITILDHARTVLQGNLNEIKKSYGRIHLSLKTEGDATEFIHQIRAEIQSQKDFEYNIRVSGEQSANRLLSLLTQNNIPVIRFDLNEPTLHQIFVEKAGEIHED